jgi:ribosomal-protein-alanine N-acetyltransferase
MQISHKPPVLTTSRLTLRLAKTSDIPSIIEYFQANEEHLAKSAPTRPPGYLTYAFWEKQLASDIELFATDRAMRFFLFDPMTESVIGSANFTAIVRGAAHFCFLGYGIAAEHQGEGLMHEALQSAIEYVFDEMHLHRIMANYMPTNKRSGALLKRLGFKEEGYARDYLFLNGKWCDHVMTSLTNSNWQARRK